MGIASDYPDNHPWISSEEIAFINSNVNMKFDRNVSINFIEWLAHKISLVTSEIVFILNAWLEVRSCSKVDGFFRAVNTGSILIEVDGF